MNQGWTIVPDKILRANNLNFRAKALLWVLLSKMDKYTKQCYPTVKQLSIECEMSVNTIRKCLKELERLNIIEVGTTLRWRKDVKHNANKLYTITHSDTWVLQYRTIGEDEF